MADRFSSSMHINCGIDARKGGQAMKTIEEVLRECPKHDCAYVLINSRWHRIEEHEVRAIQAAIAEGDLDNKDVRIKFGGEERKWDWETPWRFDDLYGTNIFDCCSRLWLRVLRVERNKEEQRTKQNE